ncbi:hypothetical protein ACERIM_17150 [Natrinema sp. H-ect1]|uniref:hypothetical protein n=1 Tax=unclassified Natrinema TaxID=2622230 RepID=UPI00359EE143
MGNIESKTFIVDRFEFIQTWMECVMYDPGDERYPDVLLHSCGHPCLPFDARYQSSHVTLDFSISREPTGVGIDIGPARSVTEFETTFERQSDKHYAAACMGAEGYEYDLSLESECLPSWVAESDEVTGYATVELTYDEELTKSKQRLSDEEIERKREEFRALFDDWDLEYGPDATPRP